MKYFFGIFVLSLVLVMGAGCAKKPVVQSVPSAQLDTDSASIVTVAQDGKGSTSTGMATSTTSVTSTAASSVTAPAATSTFEPRASSLPMRAEIQMTENGFTPSEVKIAKGGTVVFKNTGAKAVWPASSKHPAHLDYPAFDPKKGIEPGGTYEISFPDAKTYFFHDHIIASHFGKVIVE